MTSFFQSNVILRCEPTGLASGKPEDRLREPRRMLQPSEGCRRPGHPSLSLKREVAAKTWIPGPSPGMTLSRAAPLSTLPEAAR